MGSSKVISAKESAALVSENTRLMEAVFLTFYSRFSQEESLFVSCRKTASFSRKSFVTKAIIISQDDDVDRLVGLLIRLYQPSFVSS